MAERQAIFWNYFDSLQDVQLLQVYPRRWKNLERKGGFYVGSYDMFSYLYRESARRALKSFKPEIVYVQQEAYANVTNQIIRWCESIDPRPKVGVFVWENIRKPEIPKGIDFIVAGNLEAGILHSADRIIPQVGVDFDLFKILREERKDDTIFASRKDPSKGWDLVEKLPFKLSVTGEMPYGLLPNFFNQAKVHIILSRDTPNWKEQFLPYSNVEALACGLKCVVGETSSTRQWGIGCPGMYFVPSTDFERVKEAVASALKDWKVNQEGREWARERFSKEVVAEKLYDAFKGAL